MKLKPQYILFLIILYPVFYYIPFINSIGFTFENIYFLGLLFIIFFIIIFNIKSTIPIDSFKNIFLLSLSSIIVIFNTSTYYKPLTFFLYTLFFYVFLHYIKPKTSSKLNKLIVYLYFIFSILSIFNSTKYLNQGRFSGFLDSPTVFSVFIEFAFILFIFNTKNTLQKVIAFAITFFLIYISQTRINLALLILIPIIIPVSKHIIFRKTIFLLFFFILNLLYPTYDYLSKNSNFKKSTQRKSSTAGSSFETRLVLYNDIRHEIKISTPGEIILGHGAGHMRKVVHKKHNIDILPHNDFLRIFIDFGLIVFLLFFIFLYRISINNQLSFIISLLYLSGYYHNMIYTYMLISVIIYFNFIKQKNKIQNENLVKSN